MKKHRFIAIITAAIFAAQCFTAFATEPPTPSAASSTSSSSSTPSSSESNKPVHIFDIAPTETPEVYITNLSSPTYLRIPNDHKNYPEIVKALSEVKGVKLTKFDADSGIDTGFFIVSSKGKKLINLRPNNIIEVDGVAFGTTTSQYQFLRDLGTYYYPHAIPIVQWFAYSTASRITKVSYSLAPGQPLIDLPSESVKIAAKELREISGKNGTTFFTNTKELENWPKRFKVVYTFDNGITFNVYTNSAYFYVESKGMSFSCQYVGDYSSYMARILELAKRPATSSSSSSNSSSTGHSTSSSSSSLSSDEIGPVSIN